MTSLLCSAREALESLRPYLQIQFTAPPQAVKNGVRYQLVPTEALAAALASSPPAETEEGNSSVGIKPSPTDGNGAVAPSTLWIVTASSGEYSDRHEWAICAHATEESARAYVDHWTAVLRAAESTYNGWDYNQTDEQEAALLKAVEELGVKSVYRLDTTLYVEKIPLHAAWVAPEARATADSSLSAEGCSEVAEGEPSQPTESILSLFSPQSLKASEKKEDQERRAVPQSTISEGWRTHGGETQPVEDDAIVDIEFSDGSVEHRTSAGNWDWVWLTSYPQVVRWRPAPLPASPDSTPDEEAERCLACDKPFKVGDRYYLDVSGGEIHADCCGPERESYTGPDGEPLGPNDPIPEPAIWTAPPALSEGWPDDRSDDQPA